MRVRARRCPPQDAGPGPLRGLERGLHPSNDCTDSPPEMPQFTGVHASLSPHTAAINQMGRPRGAPSARAPGAVSLCAGSRGTWGRKHAVPAQVQPRSEAFTP